MRSTAGCNCRSDGGGYAPGVTGRPAIVSITDEITGSDARVTVTLDWEQQEWHGHAVGSSNERARLAGEATLDALRRLTPEAGTLELLALASTPVEGIKVALAQVRMGGIETLVGSAMLQDGDDGTAAVKAVLDAVNRRLERLL